MSDSNLVYSSENSRSNKKNKGLKKNKAEKTQKQANLTVVEGPAKMRLEKKGRGGKQVTIIHNLPFDKGTAKNLMRELQSVLACGASYKNDEILINGDHRDSVEQFFKERNQKIVRSGG